MPAEKLDRVRSPIGLELNAETPEEIAVSILAEIIMLRQGGDGSVMSSPKIVLMQTRMRADQGYR